MNDRPVVGLEPWLPWPLRGWSWWTEPIRAEGLAALRIGLAAVLLADVLGIYWPRLHDLFGPDSLGSPETFCRDQASFPWSAACQLDQGGLLPSAAVAWTVAAVLLLIGWWTRVSAGVAWASSLVFYHFNPYIHNAGDTIRTIILFYLMISPCNAVWSLDSWRRPRGRKERPVFVYPWAARLLFVQMVLVYFFNGVFKLLGPEWRAGNSLHYVLADLSLARWSYAQLPLPFVVTKLLTWVVLAWELAFPLLIMDRRIRGIALMLGVLFHLGIGLSLELGAFAPYMLCLYLPLIPWEKLGARG
jgi:hypothetical protein